ncbi:hypothetical protein PR048_006591 [Dryococelus australis]|uniref:Uncharacterized protein n=1 Tax=Dryococelus australis TaxID=614101 RepID=A0ABQ9IBD5_9NEOP|nr:hypothetical protein PR048_006591 [Dryococelus australis]
MPNRKEWDVGLYQLNLASNNVINDATMKVLSEDLFWNSVKQVKDLEFIWDEGSQNLKQYNSQLASHHNQNPSTI